MNDIDSEVRRLAGQPNKKRYGWIKYASDWELDDYYERELKRMDEERGYMDEEQSETRID